MIRRFTLTFLVPLCLQAGAAFDPAKDVALAVKEGALTLTLPKGVHLKARTFKVLLASHGTLQLGDLPPAPDKDEAGDPIWRGTVRVSLAGRDLDDPMKLVVTYQPCTEGPDGMCYMPVRRTVAVPRVEVPSAGSR